MPASHDFSGSSTKAALSDEGSLNEESLCREPRHAEPFCEEAFEGWSLGEAPCLPASAASDANAGTTIFAGAAAGAAASLDAATGLTAFAGAPVDPTFRAIHACRPSLGFHFFSRPYCKPDTTGNRTKQHQARVPTRFFLPAFIPLFRATAFDYSFTIEITPKETGNHVLQPLWSRKQERGSVLSKLRKRIERKLISRRRPLGI